MGKGGKGAWLRKAGEVGKRKTQEQMGDPNGLDIKEEVRLCLTIS